jgi:predicted nuclease of predicted toxin-antitoxin system
MIWLDAQLSPRVAAWIRETLGHDAKALRDIGLRDAEDEEIFRRAKQEKVILLTKDKDFVDLVARIGPPPSVIWLRCGNTSEARLKQILTDHLDKALGFLASGDHLVEIQ